MKTNINRPFLKREDITDRSNFKDVLLKSKGVRNPFYKSTKWIAGLGIAASVIIVVYFYESGKSKPFINPPLAGINIPVVEYAVNSQQDTTLVYETGSSISIPANTFMDSKGHLVSGKVNVHYREFHDAVDFFVSGIPMAYDSGGVSYTFQSAGMMEIDAFQNGERLTMNPEKKISVSLASDQKEDKFNLYALDTVAKRWVYKGRPNTVVNEPSELVFSDSLVSDSSPARPSWAELAAKELKRVEASKPLEPKKATDKYYRFTLDVDSAEFPEIAVYKNLLFEVGAENTNFDSKTDQTTWENVSLKENKKGKNYLISLTKGKNTVSYIVYPVFEGKNYDAAMLQYKVKYTEYERKLEIKKFEQERALAEAKKEEARQRYEQERQNQIESENQRKLDEAARKQAEIDRKNQASMVYAAGTLNFTTRQQFAINTLGTWNCDNPMRYEFPTTIQASFKDKSGNKLDVHLAYLVDRTKGLIFNYTVPFKNLQFDAKTENILFTVLPDERIAVFTAEKFQDISKDGAYTFMMEVSDKKYSSVKQLKELLGV